MFDLLPIENNHVVVCLILIKFLCESGRRASVMCGRSGDTATERTQHYHNRSMIQDDNDGCVEATVASDVIR